MYLAKLRIKNFRGILDADIKLSPHTILLGTNNSGKSTIIDAIGLLLGKETLVHNIGDYDFYGGNPKPNDRIIIKGLLTDFASDEIGQNGQWFNDRNGGIPKWYDESTGEIYNEQNPANSLKLAVIIGFCARFDKEDLEFVTKRFFVISTIDPFEDENLNTLNRSLTKDIGFFLLPSKRNWERIISFGSEIFRKVVSFQNAIPAESICEIRDEIRRSENGIENEAPFKDIIERINKEISSFTGKPSTLSFLPTNADIESVLKSITPFLNGNSDTKLPLGCHGSGIISLQTLLLLLEFGRYRQGNSQNFILAAEEPELHLHPGMHRRLVGRIRDLSTQTIITTHSPEIAAYYKPQEINIVHTTIAGQTWVKPLLQTSTPPQNALMKLFTVYRQETSEALMHSKAIIPEGISEFYWFNKLINASITTEGWNPNSAIEGFGIIPTQDSNVLNTYKALIHVQTFLIPFVDGDTAGDNYVNDFKKDINKPLFVLQLPKNKFFEHLIAWIISPENESEKQKLEQILSNKSINYYDLEELGSLLETQFKTYWKVHDEIIDAIISTPSYSSKAKQIIEALDCIFEGALPTDYDKFWIKDESNSEIDFTVLKLGLF